LQNIKRDYICVAFYHWYLARYIWWPGNALTVLL